MKKFYIFDSISSDRRVIEANTSKLNPAALSVMTETLNIESIPCRESALHGLGHWHAAYPAEVELIIDRLLSSYRELRPETVNYAKSARCGCVQ